MIILQVFVTNHYLISYKKSRTESDYLIRVMCTEIGPLDRMCAGIIPVIVWMVDEIGTIDTH